MTNFGSSKIIAGIGSLIYGSIIGIILVLIGMKGLAEHYKDNRIYDGLVKGVILLIVGTILPIAGILTVYFGVLSSYLFSSSYSSGYYGGYDSYGTSALAGIIGLIAVVIVCFVVAFILDLLAMRYIKNCFHTLAERSNTSLFHTAATLMWVGAILAIIGIGFFFIWIGFIIAAIGFFTLDEKTVGTGNASTPPQGYTQPYGYTTQQPNTQPPPPSSTAGAKANFCPNCGAAVRPNATFCANCGKQI